MNRLESHIESPIEPMVAVHAAIGAYDASVTTRNNTMTHLRMLPENTGEGGELVFAPAPNYNLNDVHIDIYGNVMRFFTEYNGNLRVCHIDFAQKQIYWN